MEEGRLQGMGTNSYGIFNWIHMVAKQCHESETDVVARLFHLLLGNDTRALLRLNPVNRW